MLRILFTILAFIILTACNERDIDRLELIPEPDKAVKDKYEEEQKQKQSVCTFSNPDTSLANIKLGDSKSTISVIGSKDNYYKDEKYHYCSSICREALTLTQHPGDGRYSISIFKVEFSRKADHGYRRLNIDTFKTEKGIKLGMSKRQIIEKLGNCYTANDSSKNYIELYYRIEQPNDSKTKILESQNMPIYYATYKLRMDKLEMFEFGFEYP